MVVHCFYAFFAIVELILKPLVIHEQFFPFLQEPLSALAAEYQLGSPILQEKIKVCTKTNVQWMLFSFSDILIFVLLRK